MKNSKKIFIGVITLIVIFLGVVFVASHEWSQGYGKNLNATSTTAENSMATSSDTAIYDTPLFARMYLDGSPLTILTTSQDTGTERGFIFTGIETGKTINALVAENYNIEEPEYHLVHGTSHDWLAVTTIEQSGTGFIKYIDTWYALDASGNPVRILSYPSKDTLDDPIDEGKLTTSATVSQNDSVVDVQFTVTCTPSPTSFGETNDCVPFSRTGQYVWDTKNHVFALDQKHSDITENSINDLFVFPLLNLVNP